MSDSKLRDRCSRCNQFAWADDLEDSAIDGEQICESCANAEFLRYCEEQEGPVDD